MIMRHVLTRIRRHFPDTYILVRGGDRHFSGAELMQLIDDMLKMDFIVGFSSNLELQARAKAIRQRACALRASAQTQDLVPEQSRSVGSLPIDRWSGARCHSSRCSTDKHRARGLQK